MGFIRDKVHGEIDKISSLSEEQKEILKREYDKGNISLGELLEASKDKKKKEELSKRCENEVKNAYKRENGLLNSSSSIREADDKAYGYKPVDAQVFWKVVKTKPGYIMEKHFSGRYRILTDKGRWVESGSEEKISKLFEEL